MPEESHQKMKDAHNHMEEKAQDDKQDYQPHYPPYPRTNARKINDHFRLTALQQGRVPLASFMGGVSPPLHLIYAVR